MRAERVFLCVGRLYNTSVRCPRAPIKQLFPVEGGPPAPTRLQLPLLTKRKKNSLSKEHIEIQNKIHKERDYSQRKGTSLKIRKWTLKGWIKYCIRKLYFKMATFGKSAHLYVPNKLRRHASRLHFAKIHFG